MPTLIGASIQSKTIAIGHSLTGPDGLNLTPRYQLINRRDPTTQPTSSVN
ncbi:MAG: hypothetical protein AAFY78_00845 [Cyanobacteria bacterium J06648_16]